MSMHRKLASRWTTVALFIVAGWLFLQAGRLWFQVQRVDDEVARLEDLAYQTERDIERQKEFAAQAEDERWLEHQARLRLNYKHPDEGVAVVYKDEKAGTIAPAASASGEVEASFLEKIWSALWR